MPPSPKPQLMHRLPITLISTPLLILFLATAFLLFLSSDKNVESLWSQCSSPSAPPSNPAASPFLTHLSDIPFLGPPACFLISFFTHALASSRAFAIMSAILSFVGALLTVSTIESARICNLPNPLIRNPTLPWLFFNLAGGAVAWQALIVPAFIHRSRRIHHLNTSFQRSKARTSPDPRREGPEPEIIEARDPNRGRERRYLHNRAETYAIPLSIALGYIAPSLVMLFSPDPISVAIWLFFPLWVSIFRQAIRWMLTTLPVFPQFTKDETDTHHLESDYSSLWKVYALPILLSVISQAVVFKSLLEKNDGSETTRAALKFIEIDFSAIALTVFYWMLLEAGWKILGVSVLCSFFAGPGAGLVLGWILKESKIEEVESQEGEGVRDEQEGRDGGVGDEVENLSGRDGER